MDQEPPKSPTAVIAERMRDLRTRRRWSAQRLAGEMTNVGVEWNRGVVTKLENNRREAVSVTELMALAYVLEVSPLALLLPEENTSYQVTPEDSAPARTVYEWISGDLLPPFPFPLEGITDEDRTRARSLFTRLLAYVTDLSEHWVVKAEIGRLKEREQRLVVEAKLREAMDSRRAAQDANETVVAEAQQRLMNLRMQLDKVRSDAEERGADDDELSHSSTMFEVAIDHAQQLVTELHYRQHRLTEELDQLTKAMKELDNGANDAGR